MNKKLTAAFDAAKNDPTEENVKALADIAVPKFKEVYGRIQKAVRTVNRHVGVNKGSPNRATLAVAFGLKDDLNEFKAIGGLINEQNMTDSASAAYNAILEIETMRMDGSYGHVNVLPDFYTKDEIAERKAIDAKMLIANITNAVRAAIDTINRHIVDGTFDPNTFKIAKVVGYWTYEMVSLSRYLEDNANDMADIITEDDIAAFDKLEVATRDVLESKKNGFKTAVAALPEYFPFATTEKDDDVLDEGEECGEE